MRRLSSVFRFRGSCRGSIGVILVKWKREWKLLFRVWGLGFGYTVWALGFLTRHAATP